jgi:spermidine synthase
MLSKNPLNFMIFFLKVLLIVISLSFIFVVIPIWSFSQQSLKIIYHEVKAMGPIWVFENKNIRCLSFVEPGQVTQTCLDLNQPLRLVSGYQQVIAAATLAIQTPKSICIVGLGGGALPKALQVLYPKAIIDIVELNPDVVDCAERYFSFKPYERLKVIIGDGVEYFKNISDNQRYDMVVMDAFDAIYIPPDFLTEPFVESVYHHLNEDGVVFVNTFKGSKFYEREMELYSHVFETLYQPEMPTTSPNGNRILMAVKGKILPFTKSRYFSGLLQQQFKAIGINADSALSCVEQLKPLT